MKTPDDAIAHRVLAHEDFDETARILLKFSIMLNVNFRVPSGIFISKLMGIGIQKGI